MTTELCYNDCAEANGKRGVLLLNAIGQHNLLLWAKRPLLGGFTSRHSLQQRWQPSKGRFVMKQCTKCKEYKELSEFGESKTSKDGLRHWCKECIAIRWKLWYQANRDKKRELDRTYQKANPEKRYEYGKRYRAKNPKKSAENGQRWRDNNPEAYKARSRTDAQRWRKNNPEASKAIKYKRDARKIINGGAHTVEEWEALCGHYDNRCLACGESKPLTVDHVIPISKGGSNDISNIQPLCGSCNSSKKDRVIDYRY